MMAERIAYLDALIGAMGWSHKVKRGGALEAIRREGSA